MASNHTQTYGLNQWALSDSVIMADFNQDNLKTEQALLALKEEFKSDDQQLQQALLTLEEELIAADREVEQTLTAALPKFAMGSYTGTGTKGAENPKSLTFAFEPKLLIVAAQPAATNGQTSRLDVEEAIAPLVAIRGASTALAAYCYGSSSSAYTVHLTWSGKTVSWYCETDSFLQYNDPDTTYRYLAIG